MFPKIVFHGGFRQKTLILVNFLFILYSLKNVVGDIFPLPWGHGPLPWGSGPQVHLFHIVVRAIRSTNAHNKNITRFLLMIIINYTLHPMKKKNV